MFTVAQKYIFNVHQITTLCGKFNIFLARVRTKNTDKNLLNHAIASEKLFLFLGEGPSPLPRPIPVERGIPSPDPTLHSSTKPSGSASASLEFQPDLCHCQKSDNIWKFQSSRCLQDCLTVDIAFSSKCSLSVYYQRPCLSYCAATMQPCCILKLLLPTHYQGLKRVTYWPINIPHRWCLQELPEHQNIDSALLSTSSCHSTGNAACLAALRSSSVGDSFLWKKKTEEKEEEDRRRRSTSFSCSDARSWTSQYRMMGCHSDISSADSGMLIGA